MATVVREKYPVEDLPEDLRKEVAGAKTVRVTLQTDAPLSDRDKVWEQIDALRKRPDFKPRSNDDINTELRALRDEWD
jgi:hypothetical protein